MAEGSSLLSRSTSSTRESPNPFRPPKLNLCSASPMSNRTSLQDFSLKMRARKIHMYRNGDPFFKGMTFAITDEHFRTFNSFLSEINKSAVCDPSVLKKGARHIFTLNGNPVTALNQLHEGHSYVCSSTPVFKKLSYENISNFNWFTNFSKVASSHNRDDDEKVPDHKMSSGTEFVPSRPKMVVVIRAGPRPRNLVRMLLNRRTATSYDQVLTHLAAALNMKTGTIRKIYSLSGQEIHSLAGFYSDDNTFVAFESDRMLAYDLQLSENEVKFVESSCATARVASGEGLVKTGIADDYRPQQDTGAATRKAANCTVVPREDPRVTSSPQLLTVRPPSPTPKQPKTITIVNRGHSGEDYGIPMPLLAKYKIGRVLRKGNFVLVKRCNEKNKYRSLALKIIDLGLLKSQEDKDSTEYEVDVMRKLCHPNILEVVDELITPSEIYLVMEYFKLDNTSQGGFLLNFFVEHDLTEFKASGILQQLCMAIAHIHSLNIIHCNIRPDKILVFLNLDGSCTVKLGDFGLAVETNDLQFNLRGTAAFMAPEMLACTGYGEKVDIWACGIIMCILLSGQLPFGNLDSECDAVLKNIRSGRVDFSSPQWNSVSDSGKDLVMFMLEDDASTRGSASEIVDHPWLSDPNETMSASHLHPSIQNRLRTLINNLATDYDPCATLIATTALDRGRNFSAAEGQDDAADPSGQSSATNLG